MPAYGTYSKVRFYKSTPVQLNADIETSKNEFFESNINEKNDSKNNKHPLLVFFAVFGVVAMLIVVIVGFLFRKKFQFV